MFNMDCRVALAPRMLKSIDQLKSCSTGNLYLFESERLNSALLFLSRCQRTPRYTVVSLVHCVVKRSRARAVVKRSYTATAKDNGAGHKAFKSLRVYFVSLRKRNDAYTRRTPNWKRTRSTFFFLQILFDNCIERMN